MGFFDFFDIKCERCKSKGTLYTYNGLLLCSKCLTPEQKQVKKEEQKKGNNNWNHVVTPRLIDDFIGQAFIKDELNTMIKAQKIHNMTIPHCLFSGGFGLGKTTIATLFARIIDPQYKYVIAHNMNSVKDFPSSNVVIVDEIHTLRDEEWLLAIMDKEERTILGATTRAGDLSPPLRSRFISLVLQPYTVPELKEIVFGACRNINFTCPDYAQIAIAQRSKQVARNSLILLKRIYDRAILYGLSKEKLQNWFKEMEIDEDGLDNADRAYIHCLSNNPIGIQNISAMTGLDVVTLQEVVEPYLLIRGFVRRTPRGRILGSWGKQK
jgi:Holliday junction DNA helicase RuvB